MLKSRFAQTALWPIVSFLVLIALGFAADKGFNEYTQLILLYMCVNIVLALSLNLVSGFTGQFSLGHAGFMAIGAYVSASLTTSPHLGGSNFYCFPLYAVCGGLVAAFAGWCVGQPSLRLRGDYLAIVTLGFSEIIRTVLLNMQSVGGARGMYSIPGPSELSLGFVNIDPFMSNFIWSAFWVMVTFVVCWRLVRSTHGRGFLSVREDEIAAEAMGINTTSMKVRAFVISSFFAGVAGAMFASAAHYLNPSTFVFSKSVDVVIMVVLGGMGSLTGSVVAAMFVTIFPELVLRPLQAYTHVDLRMVIYALTLVVFMVLRPQGIFGTTEITHWFRSRFGGGAGSGSGRAKSEGV